jgi:small ligand-binding sensory domain FIST
VLSHLGSESAVEALLEDIGLPENSRPEELRNALNGLHVAFPIKGADRQDYLVRNITGIDLAQGLIGVAEAAEDGARVFFCRRDKQSAAKDLKDMAFKATKRLGKPARGAIYISCLARGPNLFGPNSEEIAIVKEAIGENVPVVGFFANGEIAHDRLYGYTGVLTLFG